MARRAQVGAEGRSGQPMAAALSSVMPRKGSRTLPYSTQQPAMAGAIQLPSEPEACLPLLLDILYTPWEVGVAAHATGAVCAAIARRYGEPWAGKFMRAIEIGNYQVSKMHSPDLDQLRREIAALRNSAGGWMRRVFGERNA